MRYALRNKTGERFVIVFPLFGYDEHKFNQEEIIW